MSFLSKFDKLLIVLVVVVLGVVFVSAALDQTKPYHFLQQVAKSASDLGSVDNDSDGVIDLSNRATVSDKSDLVKCVDGTYKSVNDCISSGSGILTPSPCGANQVLKRNSANDAWVCSDDLTGGTGSGDLDCITVTQTVSTMVTDASVYADCGTQRIVTGGGCSYTGMPGFPEGNKWRCWNKGNVWGTGDVNAYARCCAGGSGSATLPTCSAGQYIKKKADNSGWECVSLDFENQVKKLTPTNITVELQSSPAATCETIDVLSLVKLTDGTNDSGIRCGTKDDTHEPYGRIKIDLGKEIKGVVYVSGKIRSQFPDNPGSGNVGISVYSSPSLSALSSSINNDLIDSVGVGSTVTSDINYRLNGVFEGRYLYFYFKSYLSTPAQLDINVLFDNISVYQTSYD